MSRPSKRPSKRRGVQPVNNNKDQALVQHTETFQGPIPHPSILEKYEGILPGAADRILQMAESESLHRRELEKHDADSALKLNSRNESLSFISGVMGQIVAGVITVSAIAAAVICILNDKVWSGGFLGGLPIAAIVYIFVTFKEPKDKSK